MSSKLKPWVFIAVTLGAAFIVWLAVQMARGEEQNGAMLAIAAGGILAGVAMAVGWKRRGADEASEPDERA